MEGCWFLFTLYQPYTHTHINQSHRIISRHHPLRRRGKLTPRRKLKEIPWLSSGTSMRERVFLSLVVHFEFFFLPLHSLPLDVWCKVSARVREAQLRVNISWIFHLFLKLESKRNKRKTGSLPLRCVGFNNRWSVIHDAFYSQIACRQNEEGHRLSNWNL